MGRPESTRVRTAVVMTYTGVNPEAPGRRRGRQVRQLVSIAAPGKSRLRSPTTKWCGLRECNAFTLTGSANTSGGGWTSSGANDSIQPAGGLWRIPASSPTAANWTTETLALRPLSNQGITIARPSAPTSGDFLIVTVTANGLASGASICAPDDGTWTRARRIDSHLRDGQPAKFVRLRPGSTSESYTFYFEPALVPRAARRRRHRRPPVAVRFTGVNPITPINYNSTGTALEYASAPRRHTLPARQ